MDKIKASQFADLAYYCRFKPSIRTITFAAPTTTLTNFPALVKCNSTFNIGTSTGYDVHFQDLSGNELYFDLDYYDPVTGNGAWWVLIPSLSSSGPTSIKMLYGDSSVTTNGSTPATVWNGYLAVYHFSDTDTTQKFNSATGVYDTWSDVSNKAKTLSLVSGGATGRLSHVSQRFSNAWTNKSTLTGNISSTREDILNVMTVLEANSAWGVIGADNTARLAVLGQTGVSINLIYVYTSHWYYRQTPYTVGNIEYDNVSWQNSSHDVSWQIDSTLETGSLQSSWTPGSTKTVALQAVTNGSYNVDTTYKIDELRMRRAFASPDYASYEYNQLMNHATYTTYGPEA